MLVIDKLNVLLVEDDVHASKTIRMMLDEVGVANVHYASTGAQAQDILDEGICPIDIIISDWNMPEQSGLDLLQVIRSHGSDLPFLMITARADVNSVNDALACGVDAYVRKPFSIKDIEDKLLGVIARVNAGR